MQHLQAQCHGEPGTTVQGASGPINTALLLYYMMLYYMMQNLKVDPTCNDNRKGNAGHKYDSSRPCAQASTFACMLAHNQYILLDTNSAAGSFTSLWGQGHGFLTNEPLPRWHSNTCCITRWRCDTCFDMKRRLSLNTGTE